MTAAKATARTKSDVPALRQDAVRNRALLVEAAIEVFRERGLGATLDEIAARAGVGTGTAYRHFRNKHEIAVEVLSGATEQIVLDAQAALALDDPWLAVVAFFESIAERQARDRGLYQVLAGQGSAEHKAQVWPHIVSTVTELFDRAKRTAAIRRDAEPEDVAVMFAMLGVVFDMSRGQTPDPWRRYLALMLDGLRARNRAALPVAPPAFGSLDDVIAAGKGPFRR
ncbi:MAG: TetR family transcriptional regulator [Ilumatobacteraceae bacterium]|nr:TetR family transcriptional regulator [Ilumatobacteraceae bacterium]